MARMIAGILQIPKTKTTQSNVLANEISETWDLVIEACFCRASYTWEIQNYVLQLENVKYT